ncbi:hypothetical protein AVDCRST_MAG81-1413 [uncultured Synechococcales cyanobacterium]|uniref:Uncharacterized protein n=1 Tax=uncultured Synechococcales cyanobacterium TaxID=1936017 RepID=A0A6J4V4E1_9CYAN|nr:hypothetical protein AVDCRST_MAG81-1413 [uncultured Synechococcales cyanobacterium]
MPLSNLTHDHKSVGAWNNRGLVRKKLDDFIGALRDFTEVLWLQSTSAGASRQQNQPALTDMSDEEYAAALVAGFVPETGEQLFSRLHIRELIEEYQEAEGKQRESLLYLIGEEGGVITVEDAEEIYMQVAPKLLEHHCRKVEQFINQQLQTLIDPCPEVHCELHGQIAIFIHQRTELGIVRYGYSLSHTEWLTPGSTPGESFTEPKVEGDAEFERVLGNARSAVLDHNLRFIRSRLHEHILSGDYAPYPLHSYNS